MEQLEKILVPIDLKNDSTEQLETVVKMANVYNSEVIITYVLSEEVGSDDMRNLLIKDVTESLDKIIKTLKDEKLIVHEPIITHGKLIDSILKVAVKEGVSLIIAGSGNKSINNKHRLGSTVEKLMRHSAIPVWVVRNERSSELTNIICPVDFSDPSRYALKNAIFLARDFKANLRIFGVAEELTYVSPRIHVDLKEENARRMKLLKTEMDAFLEEFDLIGVKYEVDLRLGNIASEILSTIEEKNHDLLIMGTTGRSGIRKVLIGSVTEKVTRQMPCSFITTTSQDFIQSKLQSEMMEIEAHLNNAIKLMEKESYQDAVKDLLACLRINHMYIPAHFKLAQIYTKTGDEAKAQYYTNMTKELKSRLWHERVENEIREYYSSKS